MTPNTHLGDVVLLMLFGSTKAICPSISSLGVGVTHPFTSPISPSLYTLIISIWLFTGSLPLHNSKLRPS